MVSVIIPARNENRDYVEKTVRSVLDNAQGEIEVLVELDGWLPDPAIDMKDDRVIFIHHEKQIGQRACINHAASICTGEYIMKLDAHCAVGPGFDVILARDCKPEWTLVPRMYNLDIKTFKPKLHKRTDYMYISSPDAEKPFRAQYFGSRQPKNDKMIDETMCCMGPGWFLHKKRFLEQGGCDEGHEGGWGQQGIEVSLKAWLSGGALMVDKNTWFAHWFRGGSYNAVTSPGFPYKISGNQIERVRKYSRDLWLNNKWSGQKRTIEWLIKKFNPPTWDGGPGDIYIPRRAKSHVWGQPVRVENMVRNLEHYWDRARRYRAKPFIQKGIPFFKAIADGKTFTDKELLAHPYASYIKSGIRSSHIDRTCLRIMKDGINLFHDIKANGMKAPVEVWVEEGRYNISRGTRRLVILHLLGRHNVMLRVYKNKEYMEKLRFKEGGRITAVGVKQYQRWGGKATDKHWMHDYLPYYDKHLPKEMGKILEIGVKKGGSLMLWREAYPNAKVYGVDLDIKQATLVDKEVVLLEGSQIDERFNKENVISEGPFDLIVDDASHIASHQIKGFELLWPSVKVGGWYVVEDLYFRNYHMKEKGVSFVKTIHKLIDEMNEHCTMEIHMYYNIILIRRLC